MTIADKKTQTRFQEMADALGMTELIPKVHSTIFWRWKKSEVRTWSEAFVGEINGEFINVGDYPKTSPMRTKQ